jgi:hypothetical protein
LPLESRARELDHLGPLLGFIGDELAEVGRPAPKPYTAKGSKPRLDLGIGKSRVDLLVECIDDLGARVFLRSDPRTSPPARGRVVSPDVSSPNISRD